MNLANVRLLVTDVDGVMTDDTFEYSDGGQKRLRFNNADGQGILRLWALCGIKTVFLTQDPNADIEWRSKALGCPLIIGDMNKLANLRRFYLDLTDIPLAHVAYIGNDENDRKVLAAVGFPFVPRDAVIIPSLRDSTVDPWEVLHRLGGHGCVREVCEMIISARRLSDAEREWMGTVPGMLDRTQTL